MRHKRSKIVVRWAKVALKTLPVLVVFNFVLWIHRLDEGSKPQPLEMSFQDSYFSNNINISHPVPLSLNYLRKVVHDTNFQEKIHNVDLFPPLDPMDPIIVVQVHNRIRYLQKLISSLKTAKGIERVLLIFSHDVYDPNINELISTIDFCKFMQIFYPFSLQLFPTSFPGHDKRDCDRNIKPITARKIRCLNANFPDSYGHYREAKYTQTKHHWFWKANFVINRLRVTSNHSGPYVFLEEDHYVSPDIFHYLQLMILFKKLHCPECDILTLGIYTKLYNFRRFTDKVEIVKWHSSRHNMGMVFDKKSWSRVTECAVPFCSYDDYNWDWSLQYLNKKCLESPFRTLVVAAPRVFHIGECGVHHKGKDCKEMAMVRKVEGILNRGQVYLFPDEISLQRAPQKSNKLPQPNGGWGDKRDHLLCLHHLRGGPFNSSHLTNSHSSLLPHPQTEPSDLTIKADHFSN